jgi:hypothetical protein
MSAPMYRLLATLLITLLPAVPCASEAPPSFPPPVQLESTLVTGQQPGPGLWQVVRGDNVMWVLATITPVPRDMQWRSSEVESIMAESTLVLADAGVSLGSGFGRVQALFMMPSILAARRIPDGQTLDEVLPPELHARWLVLKHRYIGRAGNVERWRPLFAAYRLFQRAIEKSGMELRDPVGKQVDALARRHRVPVVKPRIELSIERPRQALKAFAKAPIDDIECMALTVDRLESELESMRLRANAWAVGDLEALLSLPHTDNASACLAALVATEVMQQQGLEQVPERIAQAWLSAAETTLADHRSSLAVVPLSRLLGADGYLQTLQQRGYEVIAPE